jgi:hypothetical protein
MCSIVRERLAETPSWWLTGLECASVVLTSARLRAHEIPVRIPAMVTATLLLLMLRSAAPESVDFSATDPAGEFTLSMRRGRAIAGSIDRHPLNRDQLVHAGDSIRVLNAEGRVLFAVAYDKRAASIEWAARPASCKGRAMNCAAYQ